MWTLGPGRLKEILISNNSENVNGNVSAWRLQRLCISQELPAPKQLWLSATQQTISTTRLFFYCFLFVLCWPCPWFELFLDKFLLSNGIFCCCFCFAPNQTDIHTWKNYLCPANELLFSLLHGPGGIHHCYTKHTSILQFIGKVEGTA